MFSNLFKKIIPVAAMGMGLALSGCDGMNISIGDGEGVPLAELDMSGPAPTELVLAGPDTVIVTEGDTLDIDVEGSTEIVAAMRFTNEDGTLGIMREKDSWSEDGTATVRVTMPLPEKVVIAGSGTAEIPGLAPEAEVTIAGTGSADVGSLAVARLEVTVAGSGSITAGGAAERMELTIAGSGDAKMERLKVDDAEITIAGSGDAAFASDGRVEANIVGSGDVVVTGRATCTIESMGSGTVTCKAGADKPPADTEAEDGDDDSGESAADSSD